MKRKWVIWPIAICVAAVLCAACGTEQAKQPPDKVTVQLKWVNQAQFAGFYLAQEEGYYAGQNLDVTFLEGGSGINQVETVLSGTADFGVTGSEDIMVVRGAGKPITAIAAIFRRNPLAFVTLSDSGITRPSDFAGKTAAVLGSDTEIQFNALLKQAGVDSAEVKLVEHRYDYSNLYSGEADISLGYSTGGLIRIRQAGYPINEIWPSDYRIHVYADTLFTTDQVIEEYPDMVERFLRATLQGWQKAVEEPKLAVEATMKYAKETDLDLQMEMMDAIVPLVHTGEDRIGWMRGEVWQGIHDMFVDQDILSQTAETGQVYTTVFLERVYGDKP